jgi:hypothetical protein
MISGEQIVDGVRNALCRTDAVAGDVGLGLAFGAGNTFWATASGRLLRQLLVDPGTFTASTVLAFDTTVLPDR